MIEFLVVVFWGILGANLGVALGFGLRRVEAELRRHEGDEQ